MPALPPVPNVVKIAFIHSDASDLDVVTRLYFEYTGTAPNDSALNTFATACATAWNTDLASLFNPDVTLTEVTVEDLTSPTAAVGTWSGTHAGTATGTPLPAGTAALVNYSISRRYRGGKPRSYWCMGNTGHINTAQTWTSSFISGFATDYAAFLAAIIAGAWSGATLTSQVNVSYYSGFASVQNPVTLRWKNLATPRATPLVDLVTGFSLNHKFGSQRRRNLH
jgi:hypothetical protein